MFRSVIQKYRWVILIAILYGVALFVFGGVYYNLYLGDRRSFAFNSDIQHAQAEVFKSVTLEEVSVFEQEAKALTQLSERLKTSTQIEITYPHLIPQSNSLLVSPSTPSLISPQAEFQTTEFNLVFHKELLVAQGVFFRVSVDFYNGGRQIGTHTFPQYISNFPNQVQQYQDMTATAISALQDSLAEDRRRLQTLEGATPEIWTYGDFLYFSVITQTTVGYGDILPNNTTVRIWVSVQVLVGLFLATIGIAFAFRALK